MSSHDVDRNLLFGFLALQNNFISREDLITAVSVWLADKSHTLSDILQQRRMLANDELNLIAALTAKHLERHDNDAEKTLAAMAMATTLHDDLIRLGGKGLEATILQLSPKQKTEGPNDETLPLGLSKSSPSRYRIMRPYAKGGLGQVYVAKDLELNREVALKEIQMVRADDLESRARFVLEAEITGGLEHPGVVPVYGLGQYSDGRPFYAMKFIRGESLAEAIRRFYQQPLRSGAYEAVAFRHLISRFISVCNAMEYAHAGGVIHRDLKPANVMLGKYGEALVVDWGLASAKGRNEYSASSGEEVLRPRSGSGSATQMGSAIGTPAYMSPEQATGKLDQIGPASDVYSLGATLYSLLTGRAPFRTKDTGEILRKVETGDFPSPRASAVCRTQATRGSLLESHGA